MVVVVLLCSNHLVISFCEEKGTQRTACWRWLALLPGKKMLDVALALSLVCVLFLTCLYLLFNPFGKRRDASSLSRPPRVVVQDKFCHKR